MRRRTLAALAALFLASCGDSPEPSPTDLPSFAISDAVHDAGNQFFFFLPPLVPAPDATGVFDGSLAPQVRICEWTGTACGAVVAEFTTTTGPGSETVRLVPEDEHWVVNWHTDEFGLDTGTTYRISVLVIDLELGFADVDLVNGGKDLKSVDTGEFIALKDGRTLPIKFRIDEGAVFVIGEEGGTVTAAGGSVVLDVPAGALGEDVPITVELDVGHPPSEGLIDGAGFEFGPDGLVFEVPATLTMGYDEAALPAGFPETGLTLAKQLHDEGEVWEELPSTVDVDANTVTGAIEGFSNHNVKKKVASVDVDPTTVTLDIGESRQLAAIPHDVVGDPLTNQKITWSSSGQAIADVDVTGLVTAVTAGSATITARVHGVTGSAAITVPPGIPPTDAAAFYPFNGNANDESGNGNHGTIEGATLTTDRFGNAQNAYAFTSGGIRVDDVGSNLDLTGDFTIAFWARPTGPQSSWIMQKHASGVNGDGSWALFMDQATGLVFQATPGFSAAGQYTGPPLPSGGWRLVTLRYRESDNVWTFDVLAFGSGARATASGVASPPTTILDTGHPLLIGIRDDGLFSFPGDLDDIRIFKRALSDGEVDALFAEANPNPPPPPPPTDVAAFYAFNGNANDESGNGNDGVVGAGVTPTSDRFGNANSAFSFEGGSGITVPDQGANLDLTGDFSIAFWARNTSASSSWILHKHVGGLNNDGSWWLADFGDPLVFQATPFTSQFTGPTLPPSGWTFVALRYRLTDKVWTYDVIPFGAGTPETMSGTAAPEVMILDNGHPMLIGIRDDGLFPFRGDLDDIRIFKRVLSDEEVDALFREVNPSAPPPSPPADATAFYPFDGDANDASGNGNDGTVEGATLTVDRFGNANSAFSFTNGGIRVNDVGSDLDLTGDFTIAFWARPTGPQSSWVLQKHLSGVNGDGSWALFIDQATGLVFQATPSFSPSGQFSGPPLPTDGWRLVTLRYRSTDHVWMYDVLWFGWGTRATAAGVASPAITILDTGHPLLIGVRDDGLFSFPGDLDDIRIFKRALSDDEVDALFSEVND